MQGVLPEGPGSAVVAGQRVPLQNSNAWNPAGYGARLQAAPASLTTIPPTVGAGGMIGGTTTGVVSVGGYGPADNNAQAAIIAGDQPWSFVHSPLPLAVGGFVGALLALNFIFWRRGELGG